MKNILTVDLEDWFSVETLQSSIAADQWPRLRSVVERNTYNILRLFARYKVSATFFVLGWVADRYPALVADVAQAGHEIACHGYYHRMVSSLSLEQFRSDTEQARQAIIQACGRIPVGYRSPSWGMRRNMTWAFALLAEIGFKYDSSIFPIRHDIYGDPTCPRRIHDIVLPSGQYIVEVPASTIEILGTRIPIGGGGWLRQFPYWFTRRAIARLNRSEMPAVVYFHPWEMDVDIPRVPLSLKNRLRQYGNLRTMKTKVQRLLNDFDFLPMGEYIELLRKNGRA